MDSRIELVGEAAALIICLALVAAVINSAYRDHGAAPVKRLESFSPAAPDAYSPVGRSMGRSAG